ncbi:MAG: methyltransferase domain-containing protein [Hyphomicrobiales bacterium]|nr:methyltransferase domain-containing protein [Hyphomicrobiales bacterium]
MVGLYTEDFYNTQSGGSIASAETIVPIVMKHFRVTSVVDVGCGVGGWLKSFERCGVTDYLGYDGDYIPTHLLRIPADRFRAADLASLRTLERTFDLACSLEVAEHLPPEASAQFVRLLTSAAPVVMFSAAVPHQDGNGHINVRWQSEWRKLFAERGFTAVDCIRPEVYGDKRVDWWYRQNIIVYCKPELRPAGAPELSDYDLNRVDPDMVAHLALGPHSGRQAVDSIRRSATVLRRVAMRKLKPRA